MPVISTIIALLYAAGLWFWLKDVRKTVSPWHTRLLQWTHGVLLVLLAVSVWLSFQYDLSFRGVWTVRIIVWLFLLTGVFIYPFGHKSQFNWLSKIYFFLFSTLPTWVGLFLLVPFLGVVIVFSLYGRLSGTGDTVLYSDKDVRVQSTFMGVLSPPFLDIYKKKGLFEKRIYRSDHGWQDRVDSVKTKSDNQQFTVTVYHEHIDDTLNPIIVTVPE